MNRTTAAIAVFALFVVGVGVGALGTHIFYAKELDRHGGPPDFGARRFVTRLQDELGLTEEQTRRIEQIRDEARIEADALHEEMLPRVREHMQRTRERIREVLTPEQQVRFDELDRRHREHAEQFFLGRGGHHRHAEHPHERVPPSPPQPPPDD